MVNYADDTFYYYCDFKVNMICEISECERFEAKPKRDYVKEFQETEKDIKQLKGNRKNEAKRKARKLE